MKPKVLFPNGETEVIMPNDGEYFSLGELENIVNGFIYIIDLGFWRNEEMVLITGSDITYPETKKYNQQASDWLPNDESDFYENGIFGKALLSPKRFIE